MQERWEVYRVTYVIARFLALNGVASIEVWASHLQLPLQLFPASNHTPPAQQPASHAVGRRRRMRSHSNASARWLTQQGCALQTMNEPDLLIDNATPACGFTAAEW